jgi:hypothetical protein
MKNNHCILAEVRDIGEGVKSIQERMSTQIDQSTELLTHGPEASRSEVGSNNHPSPPAKVCKTVTQISRRHYHKYALHVVWEKTDKRYQTRRQIVLKLFIGSFTIVQFGSSLHTSMYDPPDIFFNFRVRNIISRSSDIVEACERGNIAWVKELFELNAARPNDMTDEQHPLLWVRVLDVNGRNRLADEHSVVCDSERLSRGCTMPARLWQ